MQLKNINCQPPSIKHPSIKTSTKQHGNLFKQLFKNKPQKNQMEKLVSWVGEKKQQKTKYIYIYIIHIYMYMLYIFTSPPLSAYFTSHF